MENSHESQSPEALYGAVRPVQAWPGVGRTGAIHQLPGKARHGRASPRRKSGGRQDGSRAPFDGLPDWWPDWRGKTIVIVAGGPSAKEADLASIRGHAQVIAINTSWQLAPWASILYACDFAWWDRYGGVPDFGGLKLSIDRKACERSWGVQRVGINKNDDRLELMKFGTVGWAGNSGFHCINLAVQMLAGSGKIILVGMDMSTAHGLHWHGKHPDGLNNPREGNVMRWRRCVDAAAEVIDALGIKVINASPISALQNYPKMTLQEAIEC